MRSHRFCVGINYTNAVEQKTKIDFDITTNRSVGWNYGVINLTIKNQ